MKKNIRKQKEFLRRINFMILEELHYLFITTILKKEGFVYDPFQYREKHVFEVRFEDIRLLVNIYEMKVLPEIKQYIVKYGEDDINQVIEGIRKHQIKFNEVYGKIKSYLELSDSDMKKYLIDNIDDVEFYVEREW